MIPKTMLAYELPTLLFVGSIISVSVPLTFGLIANKIITGPVRQNQTMFEKTEDGNALSKIGALVSVFFWSLSMGVFFIFIMAATNSDVTVLNYLVRTIIAHTMALIGGIFVIALISFIGFYMMSILYTILSNPKKHVLEWFERVVTLINNARDDFRKLLHELNK